MDILQAKQPETQVRYAGFIIRYTALVFDWEILIFLASLIVYSNLLFWKTDKIELGIGLTILYLIYRIVTTKIYGKTIGKTILGLKVTGVNGQNLTWFQAIIRELTSYFISLPFLVGEFLYFFTPYKQTIQDKIASTIVIAEHPLTLLKKAGILIIIFIIPVLFVISGIIMAGRQTAEINKKTDLIETVDQKIRIMIQTAQLCQSLPGYQDPRIKCVMNNGSDCAMDKLSLEKLQDLNTITEKAIKDCVNYQTEWENQQIDTITPAVTPF